MVPLSVLGKLRHEMVEALDAALARPAVRTIAEPGELARLKAAIPRTRQSDAAHGSSDNSSAEPTLHVLCRSLEQVSMALELGLTSLMADFQDIRHYAAAVEQAQRGAGHDVDRDAADSKAGRDGHLARDVAAET